MALANKNHMPNESTNAIIQASAFYQQKFGNPMTLIHTSSSDDIYAHHHHHHNGAYDQEPESPEMAKLGVAKNFTMSNSSSVSSPSSTNSNGLPYQANATNYNNLSEEGNSVISFRPDYGNFMHAGGPFLSFDQQGKSVQRNLFSKTIGEEEDEEYPSWDQELHHHNSYHQSQLNTKCAASHGLPGTSNNHQAYGAPSGDVQFAWLNDEAANTITSGVQELGSSNKRPSMGDNAQALKKQCGVASSSSDSKKTKSKSASTANDPQSVAAKNRRERISERLKILQDLVPNGSKVDLVTMLEKAIGYVKFLQLQVKVLATDDFWPAQGGKAPDLSQVREAIDSILASQRDRNSSSVEQKRQE